MTSPGLGVAVVGAGVFGAAAARELRRRGHAVTLLDPGPLPHPLAASTDVSKAVRMDYADPFYMDLMAEAFPIWDALNREGGEPLYHQDGFLILTAGPAGPGDFEFEASRGLAARGVAVEPVSPEVIARRGGAFASGVFTGGYFNPRAGWAESGRVVARFVEDAAARGVVLRPERVTALAERGNRVTGVVTASGERLNADVVVVAGGAWTPDFLPELRPFLHATAQPVFHFRPEDPEPFRPGRFPVWAASLTTEGWYGFPALPDGRVKVANHGPGRPLRPEDPRQVTPEEEARFREFLATALPALAGAPLAESRVCLYTDTPDGDFLIDRHPGRPGLVVATGGSGHGFKFAPVLGAVIADVVEGKPGFHASRFAWREAAPGMDTPRK